MAECQRGTPGGFAAPRAGAGEAVLNVEMAHLDVSLAVLVAREVVLEDPVAQGSQQPRPPPTRSPETSQTGSS